MKKGGATLDVVSDGLTDSASDRPSWQPIAANHHHQAGDLLIRRKWRTSIFSARWQELTVQGDFQAQYAGGAAAIL